MNSIVEFITNNYVWFIVLSIIVIMAVIGYIAEQTDFGRTKEKPKKDILKENSTDENTVEESVVEEANLEENVVNEDMNLEQNVVEPMPLNNEEIDQSLFVPLTDNSENVSPSEEVNKANEDVPVQIPSDAESTMEDDIWKF